MQKLRSRINRFFFNNRDRGIPNLMLYISVANVIVFLLDLLNIGGEQVISFLAYDPDLILHGQVWRLVTYIFLFMVARNPVLGLLGLFFYQWAASSLEQYWGTLRFNCYYLCGIVLTDLAALLFGGVATVEYINLSLFLGLATLIPDQQIQMWFVLPVKVKWMAWLSLGLTLYGVVVGFIQMIYGLTHGLGVFLYWLVPLVSILNYFLFFGKGIMEVMPDFIRYHPTRKSWKQKQKGSAHSRFAGAKRAPGSYRFKCTVCGRTDADDPKLEFRYCSKCSGYRCYCMDHINNHIHVIDTETK